MTAHKSIELVTCLEDNAGGLHLIAYAGGAPVKVLHLGFDHLGLDVPEMMADIESVDGVEEMTALNPTRASIELISSAGIQEVAAYINGGLHLEESRMGVAAQLAFGVTEAA